MLTLEYSRDAQYSITGESYYDLLEKLVDELHGTSRPIEGFNQAALEAIYPTEEDELDEDETTVTPLTREEITEEVVTEFAAKLWDVPAHHLSILGDVKPVTRGEFQATMHHLGLGYERMAHMLGVAPRTTARWIAGTSPIPAGVTADVDSLMDAHDADVQRIVELADRGVVIVYPGDEDEQQLDGAPLGWERRVVQRAMVECGVPVTLEDEN